MGGAPKYRRMNVIALYDASGERLLLCRRSKDPYKGLLNFVGGKVESGERGLDSAYRELYEETGIGRGEVALRRLMDLTFAIPKIRLEVFFGQLRADARVRGEENELVWRSVGENFYDASRFAGDGNLGVIVAAARAYRSSLPE